MIGPFFFDASAAIDMAVLLHCKGGNRIYLFCYIHAPSTLADSSHEVEFYFSHAQSDAPSLIDPRDRVECLGRAEDGEWQDLNAVHRYKQQIANVTARLQEHLL